MDEKFLRMIALPISKVYMMGAPSSLQKELASLISFPDLLAIMQDQVGRIVEDTLMD